MGKIHEIKEVELIPFEDYSKIYPDVSNYMQGLKQLLEKKGFLYSQDYNISKSLQKTNDEIDDVFNPFLFNSKILTKVMFPYCGYLIKGSIEYKVLENDGLKQEIILLSRYGCKNVDRPRNHRGLDSEGFVSNFLETELILIHSSPEDPQNQNPRFFSVVILNGDPPAFFK